jgi:oligopeptide/dipeptide ABC transporter ATP-binding protein
MYAGRIVEELTSAQVDGQASHPYSRALLAAVPDVQRPRDTPLAFIPGQPPDGEVDLIGCAYAARCPFVMDRCRSEAPFLELRPAGNRVACWLPVDGSPAC